MTNVQKTKYEVKEEEKELIDSLTETINYLRVNNQLWLGSTAMRICEIIHSL